MHIIIVGGGGFGYQLAQSFGVKKIICEVKKPQYVSVYNTLGIYSLINPCMLAASSYITINQV